MTQEIIIDLITILVPFIFYLACAIVCLHSYKNSIVPRQRNIRGFLALYFISSCVSSITVMILAFKVEVAYILVALLPCSLMFQITSILHFVYSLSCRNETINIPIWHYFGPALVSLVILIWAFFIPTEVISNLLTSSKYISFEYYDFSIVVKSAYVFCVLYGTLFTVVTLHALYSSLRNIKKPSKEHIIYISALAVHSILLFTYTYIGSTSKSLSLLDSTTNTVIFYLMTFIEVYLMQLVATKSLLFNFKPLGSHADFTFGYKTEIANNEDVKTIEVEEDGDEENDLPKISNFKLNKTYFEIFIKEYKPYLRQQLKITDFVDSLGINRTSISNFINTTYGVNFNRYINDCRIKELNRIKKLKKNKDKNINTLIIQAGFSSKRNYIRANKIHNENLVNKKR